jgi:hypothetical protein
MEFPTPTASTVTLSYVASRMAPPPPTPVKDYMTKEFKDMKLVMPEFQYKPIELPPKSELNPVLNKYDLPPNVKDSMQTVGEWLLKNEFPKNLEHQYKLT